MLRTYAMTRIIIQLFWLLKKDDILILINKRWICLRQIIFIWLVHPIQSNTTPPNGQLIQGEVNRLEPFNTGGFSQLFLVE
jgi:hypothetical protein